MYALLGDIQFDLITYFDGFESRFAADYAEHPLIEKKPRLQWIGDQLDEIRLTLIFHLHYCDPERELARLKQAMTDHRALALVLGNGDYKGWFVITEVQSTSRQTDRVGGVIALEAAVTLREWVGDPTATRPRPAVRPSLPPVPAESKPASEQPVPAVTATQVAQDIRKAVASIGRAKAALRAVTDAVQLAQALSSNPLAALGRVSGVLRGLKQVADPLGAASPALSAILQQEPLAQDVLTASTRALGAVRNAQQSLTGAVSANVVSRIEDVGRRLGTAAGALESVGPSVSRIAAKVITRKV